MLKPYNELRQVDVSQWCEERDKALYLPYNKCIDLLHEHGAEKVYFLPVPNPMTGGSLYESNTVFTDKSGNTNRCYETRIEIHIDDNVYYMQSPVMNGANPVKDNSMSQQRVWNSMTRSFVKAVAMYTGLGFDLWLKDEENERKQQKEADTYHDILKVQERVFETVTAIQKKGDMTLKDIAEKMNRTEDELKTYLAMYKTLSVVEHNLNYILGEMR
jgi:hypothetical protein